MNDRLGIGGNNPPSEAEILAQRLAAYTTEESTFKRLSEKTLPEKIEDDTKASEISDYIGALKTLVGQIEEIHTKEKKPFWDAGKAADKWKNDYVLKCDTLRKKAEPLVIAWNNEKARKERERELELAKKAREESEALLAEAAAHEAEGITDTAAELMKAAEQEEQKADMIQHSALTTKGRSVGGFSSSTNQKVWVGKIESLAAIDLEALRKYFKEDEIQTVLNRAVRDGVRDLRGAKIEEEDQLSTRRRY